MTSHDKSGCNGWIGSQRLRKAAQKSIRLAPALLVESTYLESKELIPSIQTPAANRFILYHSITPFVTFFRTEADVHSAGSGVWQTCRIENALLSWDGSPMTVGGLVPVIKVNGDLWTDSEVKKLERLNADSEPSPQSLTQKTVAAGSQL